MTNDDFKFPINMEEFAAYMDGNLSDDEMRRVTSVIGNDETMQEIMHGMKQAEETLAGYGREDLQLPEELENDDFDIPGLDSHHGGNHHGGGGFLFRPLVACCALSVEPDCLCHDDSMGIDKLKGTYGLTADEINRILNEIDENLEDD